MLLSDKIQFPPLYTVSTSASKSCIRRFVITEKAFSWLKAVTTAFTFKTLLRHYAKRALTPRSLNVKLDPRRNYHKGRAAIRHYANQTARLLCDCTTSPINRFAALVPTPDVALMLRLGTIASSRSHFVRVLCFAQLVMAEALSRL